MMTPAAPAKSRAAGLAARAVAILALGLAALVVAVAALWAAGPAPEGKDTAMRYEGTTSAPEFPAGLEWLNTDRPLSMKALRGKVVLLDFWTYCCINCMHVLPDLKRLERKYPRELVVVGVHSAKFTGERLTENIRQAVLRYEIEHPVVNDARMVLWRQYGVRAWPTLVLVDPAGKVVAGHSGEGAYAAFDRLIAGAIDHFDRKGLVDRAPLKLKLERDKAPQSLLSFPGKVLADAASARLFVSDSGHNRIVVVSLKTGAVLDVIGRGDAGRDDGPFDRATFDHPQGLALRGDALYVADTENHLVRKVDLEKRTVTTVAGTGAQGYSPAGGGPARQTALNSPWDLLLDKGDALYVAMAGNHQLWRLDLASGRAFALGRLGREARIDGPLREAALAQPSGLATDGKRIYFADSEVSSIRAADLAPGGRVETIVGGDLFDFGDVDGTGLAVRLQHPLGVAHHDGALYVADTYNNKVKRITLKDSRCETLLGSGEAGMADGPAAEATFDEPGGLSFADGKLYVADTNNHLVRVADLKTRRVETLRLKDVERLRPSATGAAFSGETVRLPAQRLGPGDVELTVSVELPEGWKLSPAAPVQVALTSSDAKVLGFGGAAGKVVKGSGFPLRAGATAAEGRAELTADLTIYYCPAGNQGLCYFKEVRLAAPVEVAPGAATGKLNLAYELAPR